jgi:hypothetical protein
MIISVRISNTFSPNKGIAPSQATKEKIRRSALRAGVGK